MCARSQKLQTFTSLLPKFGVLDNPLFYRTLRDEAAQRR